MTAPDRLCHCSKCHGPRDRPGQRYCKDCHRKYERIRQKLQRDAMRRYKRSGLKVPIGTMDDDAPVAAGSAG